jgi:hypothetical protein
VTLTVTDLFCGAGGSSSGAERVPGVVVRMAANHWRLAVDTHNMNLPHADHDCADISQVEPRRYLGTDLLWASPECTHHSAASGRKADAPQPDLFGATLPDEAGRPAAQHPLAATHPPARDQQQPTTPMNPSTTTKPRATNPEHPRQNQPTNKPNHHREPQQTTPSNDREGPKFDDHEA